MKTPNFQSSYADLEFRDTVGRNTHQFSATTKTEADGKLVGLKTYRNWKFKQAVALASALGEERKIL